MANEPLTIMAVHAHPDDETTSGGSTLIKYRAQGINTVVVTCTDGAEGEIHDPQYDSVADLVRLAEIRHGEMARAAALMNLSAHEWLGYRDSGMVGTPPNEHPENFHNADMYESTGRLIKLVRQYRPQVMFTYNAFGGYGHPDHIKAHKITVAAFDYASDTELYPEKEFGESWQPLKMYTSAFNRKGWAEVRRQMIAAGEEFPFDPKPNPDEPPAPPKKTLPSDRGTAENEITTYIDVRDNWSINMKALMEHRTQINPENPFWKMRSRFADLLQSQDAFILMKTLVPAQRPEDDLFAGIRE